MNSFLTFVLEETGDTIHQLTDALKIDKIFTEAPKEMMKTLLTQDELADKHQSKTGELMVLNFV